jgi:UDP-glucose:(heptosyl)LPS alpha-1,3-glucosyltransferase
MPTAPTRPRIAVLSPFVDKRHGTERVLAEQLERLAAKFEIHLYSSRVADLPLDRITWHRVSFPRGPHLFAFLWWLCANHFARWRDRTFRGLAPALTFSPGINCLDADLITVHVVFGKLRRDLRADLSLRRNPARAWPRLLHRRLYYFLISRLEKRLYSPRARAVLAPVSRKTARDLLALYGRSENVVVVDNGVDTARFSPARRLALRRAARAALHLAPGDFAVLLIGNGWRNKGLPCLLEAAALLRDPRLRILVVGNDSISPYEESLRRLQLSAAAVQFLPLRPDVEFYYAAADVYASPSLEDAFPLPPLEAMSCGLPAITSRSAGGAAEFIRHGEDGLVLEDPSDAKTLSQWLARLANDSAWRASIGAAASVTAARCTWDHSAQQLAAALDSILANKSIS